MTCLQVSLSPLQSSAPASDEMLTPVLPDTDTLVHVLRSIHSSIYMLATVV